MNYRTLGHTDLRVSTICLGTMQFGWTADKATSFAIMSEFSERGGNFFDTADVYSFWTEDNDGGVSETWIGEWLRQSGVQRDQVVLATKAGLRMWEGEDGAGLGRKHLMQAVEGSLRRLQVETIDLYQAHWPDDVVPIEETLHAFDDMVQQGKVRTIGCSNYSAPQLREALDVSQEHGLARFESLQPHYNMMRRIQFEGELMALCQREQIGVIPYSSLARGFLTGRYRQDEPIPEKAQQNQSLSQFLRITASPSSTNWIASPAIATPRSRKSPLPGCWPIPLSPLPSSGPAAWSSCNRRWVMEIWNLRPKKKPLSTTSPPGRPLRTSPAPA